MDFEYQRERALGLLADTGMLRDNYAPLLVRLLWRAGVQLPPPHFMPFWCIAALYALCFGPAWGLLMWVFSWSSMNLNLWSAIGGAAVAGLLYGVSMATYYARTREKYALPAWESLAR